MKIILIVLSFIVLKVISSLLYIGLLLFFFATMKRTFNMNKKKWHNLFQYKKGKGLYSMMSFPYLLMVIIMYPLTMITFELINFDYKFLGYIAVVLLPSIALIFRMPRLKQLYEERKQGFQD